MTLMNSFQMNLLTIKMTHYNDEENDYEDVDNDDSDDDYNDDNDDDELHPGESRHNYEDP